MNTTLNSVKIELESYVQKGLNFDAYFEQFTIATERVKKDDLDGLVYPQYFPINFQRLKRGSKSILSDGLKQAIDDLNTRLTWLVITEYWCGDAAQSIGLLHRVAEESNGKIDLKLVFRDEHPELMDAFLTNGSKSIPKLIQLNEDLEVVGEWGPRPKPAQAMVLDLLAEGKKYNDPLHAWYAKDRGVHLQQEIGKLIRDIAVG